MSNQIEINNKIVKYLSEISNISDPIINELIKETLKLGNVSQMQISPEQGKFLEIIVGVAFSFNKLLLTVSSSTLDGWVVLNILFLSSISFLTLLFDARIILFSITKTRRHYNGNES